MGRPDAQDGWMDTVTAGNWQQISTLATNAWALVKDSMASDPFFPA